MKQEVRLKPFISKCAASITLPGSKSLTNRGLILAALAGGRTKLTGVLFSRDTEIMMDCLSKLGYVIRPDRFKNIVEIDSAVSGIPNSKAEFFVGNAGTVARFLLAMVATRVGGNYLFDSDKAMYARPIAGLVDALKAQGSVFEFLGEPNHLPFRVKTSGLKGGTISVDAEASSQILSALLMASVAAENETLVKLVGKTVSKPFVKMTLEFMRCFGLSCKPETDKAFRVAKVVRKPLVREIAIEPDATAASYFVALPALLGGACLVKKFANCHLQGDAVFAKLLESAGLVKTSILGEDLIVEASGELPFSESVVEFDFNDISDTFLTLAAISPLLGLKMRIRGINHTRRQECDRLAAVAVQLKKLCARVEIGEDFIEIHPYWICTKNAGKGTRVSALNRLESMLRSPVKIETYEDHRMAMSFAILASANLHGDSSEWISIIDPACVSKTWKEFFEVLYTARSDSNGLRIVAIDGGAAVGKSSVSCECSKILDYMHVDTGSHYRTLSYALLRNGATPSDSSSIVNKLNDIKLGTILEGSSARIIVNGEKINDAKIRNELINSNVANFAALPEIRNFLKYYQRSMSDFARNNGFCGMIMEGRDIGSVIFPDAHIKIFLDADEATRTLRRTKEGIGDSISERDKLDKNRKNAPLICPKGAIRIDTSNIGKNEVVKRVLSLILASK